MKVVAACLLLAIFIAYTAQPVGSSEYSGSRSSGTTVSSSRSRSSRTSGSRVRTSWRRSPGFRSRASRNRSSRSRAFRVRSRASRVRTRSSRLRRSRSRSSRSRQSRARVGSSEYSGSRSSGTTVSSSRSRSSRTRGSRVRTSWSRSPSFRSRASRNRSSRSSIFRDRSKASRLRTRSSRLRSSRSRSSRARQSPARAVMVGDACRSTNPNSCADIQFSFCARNEECECVTSFVPEDDERACVCGPGDFLLGGSCVKATIGDDCSSPTSEQACDNIPFSACGSDNACGCDAGFVMSPDGDQCICGSGNTLVGDSCQPAKIGDECSSPTSEQACDNIPFSACGSDNACGCDAGFVMSPDGDQCICGSGNTLVGDSCQPAKIGDDCSSPTSEQACDNIPFSACGSDSVCGCDAGFVVSPDGDQCICGSGNTLVGYSCQPVCGPGTWYSPNDVGKNCVLKHGSYYCCC